MTAAGFKIRKVKSENSIGDKLKRVRVRKKISVAEVEEATKIRAKFILALEGDSWDQIPSEVYGRGYLETYLDFLEIAKEPIIAQYERERCLYSKICQSSQVEFAPKYDFKVPKFLFTPRTIIVSVITAVVVLFGGVMTYQLKKFTSAPFLELVTPVEASSGESAELTVTATQITLAGRTTVGARVLINNTDVAIGDDGGFREMVNVQKGLNSVVVEATNPNGKKTSEVLSVVVK